MIGVKGGTKTWSDSPQRTDWKSDGRQTISASDRSKTIGDESIGDYLNKVADPNYVDPGKKMRTVGNNQLDKDAFMNLLLTQMKNQDPTNPMKSHEMAAQLAQFTTLEKLNNINMGIAGLRKDQQPDHNFQALSFIGKVITTDTSKIARTDEKAVQTIRFSLPADAQKLTMAVKNADGKVIRTLDFTNLKAGKNEIEWNGLDDQGNVTPVGQYTVETEAIGSNGHKLGVETKTEGVISGVNFTLHGPQLMVGKQTIDLADVKSITDPRALGQEEVPAQVLPGGAVPNSVNLPPPPTATAAPQAPGAPASQGHMFPIRPDDSVHPKGLRKVEVKPETKANAKKVANMKGGDLNDAAMTQGLINRLNNAGAKAGMG